MYLIVKSYNRPRFMGGEISEEWSKITARRRSDAEIAYTRNKNPYSTLSRPITKEAAMRLIEQAGLVLAECSADGEVYDTASRDFQKQFRGVYIENEQ